MYYRTRQSPDELEKELKKSNYKKWQKNVLGLASYVVGDEQIIVDDTGWLTREDHVIFFANLIETTARSENWSAQNFLDKVQKIITYRTGKLGAEEINIDED